jgi:hypothetical protein
MRPIAAPLLALGAIASLLGSGLAAAAPLPSITVDPGYGPPLTTVKVVGRSFCATCGPVALSVAALNVDSAPVRADGTFSHLVRIPGSTRPGSVTIAATQGTTTARTAFTVTVFQPAPTTYSPPKTVPAPGNLPSATASATGTPVQSSSSSGPAPGTTSSNPPSSAASPSVSIEPTAASPVADHRSSGAGSARPIAALAAAAAALLAAGGGVWWLRRRRPRS